MPVIAPVGIVAVGRVAYTAHTRRNDDPFPIAANAEIPENGKITEDILVPQMKQDMSVRSETTAPSTLSAPQDNCTASSNESAISTESIELPEDEADAKEADRKIATTASRPIAIFPQWLSPGPTSITICEASFPHRGHSFTVTNSTGHEILQIKRERLSWSERQFVVDTNTDEAIMCVRQDIGKLPRSYRFDDPNEQQVLDLQGNFFNPVKGPKATAIFTNAIDGGAVTLSMVGTLKRRKATIKNQETDEVLADMKSSVGDARSLAGRRTYEVEISAGVDIVLIVGMVAALDARGTGPVNASTLM